MNTSGGLKLTDLDDFLTPSQACIIPVRNAAPAKEGDGTTEIHIDSENNYYEVSTYSTTVAESSTTALKKRALEKAEINLNDCLACSGCITSTESMLITLQSHNEVLDFIAKRSNPASGLQDISTTEVESPETRTPVLSISPQTLASLSAAYSSSTGKPPLPLITLLRRIRHFLSHQTRGNWRVWDTTFSRHLSLRESILEFEERRAKAKGKEVIREEVPPVGPLPILVSACPGWVCYAEKAQGDMLPMMSSVRSSQAIMGGLVKNWWGKEMGLNPDQIYHVTAMPCYDKKLEASRSDFYSAMHSTRDVDCVLTTGELDLLLQDLAFDPYIPSPADNFDPDSSPIGFGSPFPELLQHQGTSSGSYLHSIIRHIQSSSSAPTSLTIKSIRDSPDNVEYILSLVDTGEIIFKGAKCYGFRNLQNLVRKVSKETGLTKRPPGAARLSAQVAARRRKARTGTGEVSTPVTPMTPDGSTSIAQGSNGEVTPERLNAGLVRLKGEEDKKLDYVEVMACPGGCVNGGGQMKPTSLNPKVVRDEEGYERPIEVEGVEIQPKVDEGMRWSTKEWVAKVEEIYWSENKGLLTPPESPSRIGSSLYSLSSENRMENREDEEEDKKRWELADELAEKVVRDVCEDDDPLKWEFLRTRFRKVEGDILNGGVTHEAVKW